MQDLVSPITDLTTSSIPVNGVSQEDYSQLLDSLGITYRIKPPYLEVGNPIASQGWILHISAVPGQYKSLLTAIIPELLSLRVAYRIVKDQQLLKEFNNGIYGNQKVGKAITVWIEDGLDIRNFLTLLIAQTKNFTGPTISTDNRICYNLYYRYGSFKPIIITDGYGNRERLMYDHAGNLVKDIYSTPPVLPDWIKDPFIPYKHNFATTPAAVLFFKKYRPVRLLKSDKKGDVYKGLFYQYGLFPNWCIIKQGRIGIFADDGKTDMRDRILWQFQVMKELEDSVHVPHMIDQFIDKEQNFMVLSLINGESLAQKVFTIINNRPWWLLDAKEKERIILYLLQVVQQIQVLHQKGYVHRDITGTNFLVTPADKIVMIDLELAYHYFTRKPEFSFQQGTPGYMSPQQWNYETPQLTDDYYAIGALLLNCLTGIEPFLLIPKKNNTWVHQLSFFFHDPVVENFIGQCLHQVPRERPDCNHITSFLQSYLVTLNHHSATTDLPHLQRKETQERSNNRFNHSSEALTKQPGNLRDRINELIKKYIYSMSTNLLAHDGLWFSHLNNLYDTDIYPLHNKAFYGTLNRGVGGPLYFLSEAGCAGFDIGSTATNSKTAWLFLEQNILEKPSQTASGLYFGSSGVAVLLAKSIQNGMLPDNAYYRNAIEQCLSKTSWRLDIMNGFAGDGLALLYCSNFLPPETCGTLLDNGIKHLLTTQEKDGSWKMQGEDNRPEKIAGFGYGIAGIVYFLLAYIQHVQLTSRKKLTDGLSFPVAAVRQAAEQGLIYLKKQSITHKGHYQWKNSDRSSTIGRWWCHGGPGIALTFLKAYEVTGKDQYRHFAEQALFINPKELATHQISLCHGAAGLGDIYLEAFRVTQDEQWLERATRIAALLSALSQETNNKELYWNVEQREFPTADLMVGSSGIAHFLLRYLYPEQTGSPLLTVP